MAKGGRQQASSGARPRDRARHKGARGQSLKKKQGGSKVKTKSKTATRGVGRRQQQVARAKATAPAGSAATSNRKRDEAAPAAISDIAEESAASPTPEERKGEQIQRQ